MENKNIMAALEDVAERINNNEIDNLLLLNWKHITDDFQECRLKKLLGMIECKHVKMKAVRSCLACYEAYLVECHYDYYLENWECKCQFKDYCSVMLRSLENYDSFQLNGYRNMNSRGVLKNNTHELPEQLTSPFAKELLQRLSPDYCDKNGRWKDNVTVAFICQVAHVLSGLVNIPSYRKWVYFEHMWHVKGLAKAYVKLNGRPIDPVIRKLYPEYHAF